MCVEATTSASPIEIARASCSVIARRRAVQPGQGRPATRGSACAHIRFIHIMHHRVACVPCTEAAPSASSVRPGCAACPELRWASRWAVRERAPGLRWAGAAYDINDAAARGGRTVGTCVRALCFETGSYQAWACTVLISFEGEIVRWAWDGHAWKVRVRVYTRAWKAVIWEMKRRRLGHGRRPRQCRDCGEEPDRESMKQMDSFLLLDMIM